VTVTIPVHPLTGVDPRQPLVAWTYSQSAFHPTVLEFTYPQRACDTHCSMPDTLPHPVRYSGNGRPKRVETGFPSHVPYEFENPMGESTTDQIAGFPRSSGSTAVIHAHQGEDTEAVVNGSTVI